MTQINTVLTTVNYNEKNMNRLKKVFEPAEVICLRSDDAEGIEKALLKADVAVLENHLDDRYLNAPNLKWIHCDHAGLNKSARPELFEKNIILTGSAGRSAPALAEHAIYFMLSFTFAFPKFYEAQLAHDFVRDMEFRNSLRCLYGRTIGIIGVGNNGRALAKLSKAFGMEVLGYDKYAIEAPPGMDKVYSKESGDSIDELLKLSDFVVLCITLSDETYHMIGERELGIMKPTSYLVNMARGAVIDEKALIKALHDGSIAGAGLDTFEKEPLPEDSPLWDAPNAILTPHCTPQVPDRAGRTIDIIEENVKRYNAEEPMLNRLKKEYLFSK